MDGSALTSVLAVTAARHSHAFQIAAASAAVLSFVPLAASSRPRRARTRDARLLAIGIVAAAIGAAALPMMLRLPAAIATRSFAPLQIGDRMAIGALIGFALAVAGAARLRGLSPARALDRLAAPMGALVAVGRVGCFLEGCDFGVTTRVPWAVTYPAGSHAFEAQLAHGLVRAADASARPVHPTQLYESLVGAFMIAAALIVSRAQAKRSSRASSATDGSRKDGWPLAEGAAFRATIAIYAAGRIFVEALRGDDRGALGPLSTPQWMALALLAWAASGLLSGRSQTASRSHEDHGSRPSSAVAK
ncbi:MAG: prolipoprotein diacylglyceryl transferase family protein [Polyangiaceae bacterium]